MAPQARRLVSSGYTTVDVLVNGAVRVAPGGTATNVARAAASLGWMSEVVGRVGDDPAGRFAVDKLLSLGVRTKNLRTVAEWRTPVLVQEAHRGDHRWRFGCPVCGARFASHRPPPEVEALRVIEGTQAPDVFFFDRVSRFTLKLAEEWRRQGTFVVFEPSSAGAQNLFARALRVADLVKFSGQRSSAFAHRLDDLQSPAVETLGPSGARVKGEFSTDWVHVPAPQIGRFVDSAGAGDWTTAGLLDCLIPTAGRSPRIDRLDDAVSRGQGLGAEACSWEGVFPEGPERIPGDFESFACPRVLAIGCA